MGGGGGGGGQIKDRNSVIKVPLYVFRICMYVEMFAFKVSLLCVAAFLHAVTGGIDTAGNRKVETIAHCRCRTKQHSDPAPTQS